jgi:ActR/RegA family two-component response regulator
VDPAIRVLLVDDEEQFVLNLAKLLKTRGFDVATAFDGFDAVETVRNQSGFDVVVLDVKMPGKDGMATLREIKQLAPGIEVIMFTGHATLSSGIQAMREGAYDYLMKPCDIEDLIAKIERAYDVECIKRQPVLWPRNKVEEIIYYSFGQLDPNDSLDMALEMFRRESRETATETLFVLDRENRLQGFVVKQDLVQAARELCPEFSLTWAELCENPQWLPPKKLRHIMHADTITTYPEERLTDAAHRMITHKFPSMPVVRHGKVIGVVRLPDIFRYVEHEIE